MARAEIYVSNGTLSMEVDNEMVNFSIYNAMKYPLDVSSVSTVDTLDPLIDKML
ncbi:hypothetical protein Syun_001604 [Stephania yunnanensis]|uniref:Uncharacterized protein n=1 Tax=Stephania yunnanensis TaxID=152371 RepID=A0AAP0Q7X6_9MAGN